jgi:radical SAM superfamily enzyme YgiQ (UPF0313 family)
MYLKRYHIETLGDKILKTERYKRKVLLVIPNTRWHGRRPWVILPHAPLILTALLKEEFNFHILDANISDMSEETCVAHIRSLDPEALLVSGLGTEYYSQYHAVMALAKAVRPDMITILGGVYPTVLGEEAMKDPNVDYIFLGHAEERVCNFLYLALARNEKQLRNLYGIGFRDKNGLAVINPVTTYISDVKALVQPDYSLMDVMNYMRQSLKDYQFNSDRPSLPMISSYGCPYNCLFCASRTISGRSTAFRPVEDVLQEIEFLKIQYGVESITFIDDCLLASRPRIESILNAFIERNYNLTWKAASVSAWHLDDTLLDLMKRSGCTQITVSVESGSQRVLSNIMRKPLKLQIIPGIVKKCKEIGIDIGANFVIGLPGETWEEIRQTFRFAEESDFDLSHFHIATPLPKTDLYKLAMKCRLLPSDFSFLDPNFFGYGRGYITTDEFTPSELMILRAYEWDRINFNTRQKVEKVAQMMCLTNDELELHRKQTRLKCGIHF